MNAKALIPLIIGLGIAGFAAKLGFDFIKEAEGKQTKMVKLWTPIQDVKRGVAIGQSMLQPLSFPVSAAPPTALADLEKIVGRVPHTGAPAGLPILDSMLLPPGVSAGVRVPPGFRAVAVKVDESSGVDNHLEPGCRVDVVGVFTIRRGNRAETLARTIIEDVEVAAVGERLAPSTPAGAADKDGKSSKSGRRDRPPRAVTLLVKPSQVPTLHLAEQKGKIKLSMRGALDQGQGAKYARVVEDDLFGFNDAEPDREMTWRERLDEFVGSFSNEDQPQPQPEPQPPAQVQPEMEWVMTIRNGDELKLLGWADMNDMQAIELQSGGPNIFQDEPRRGGAQFPPPRPKTKSPGELETGRNTPANPPSKANSKSQSETDSGTAAEAGTESEPQELFE